MPRVSEVFSPPLTKVPSTPLGCDLAVKQVAYAKSGFLLPALYFVLFCLYLAVRPFRLDVFPIKIVFTVYTDSFYGEGMEWIYDEGSGVVVIRGSGPMPDYGRFLKDRSPWRDVFVRFVRIEEGITSIGNNAFYGCRSLESIEIPSTVERIGIGAFHGCISLESVDIPESVCSVERFAFYKCRLLEDIVLPEGLEIIENDTFALCRNLISVNIPDTVREIGNHAFYECMSLEDVTVPECTEYVGASAFENCKSLKLTFRSWNTKFDKTAFQGVREVVHNSLERPA